jgi:tRNA(Ile)-lysidine synthase TilS/MesJ
MNTVTTKPKRVTYNFKLEFPTEFTMQELRKKKLNKVSYITLYKRVENALKKGTLEIVGNKLQEKARRGRKELVYRRADAKVSISAEVVAMADISS